mgnify:CR=1 FL=1
MDISTLLVDVLWSHGADLAAARAGVQGEPSCKGIPALDVAHLDLEAHDWIQIGVEYCNVILLKRDRLVLVAVWLDGVEQRIGLHKADAHEIPVGTSQELVDGVDRVWAQRLAVA